MTFHASSFCIAQDMFVITKYQIWVIPTKDAEINDIDVNKVHVKFTLAHGYLDMQKLLCPNSEIDKSETQRCQVCVVCLL